MDYIDKSDVEVFSMKLTLVMYQRENGFHSKWSHFQQKCFKACCFVEHHSYIWYENSKASR